MQQSPARWCDPPLRPRRTPSPRRRVAAVTLVLTGLAGLYTGARVGAAPTAPTADATSAVDWLGAQLSANGNSMPGFSAGSSDWGLTADAVLAFVAAGRGADAVAQAATDEIESNSNAYTTWDPDVPDVREAGATGKVLLTVRSQGRDGSNVDGVDLEAELRSLMQTSDAQVGRFSDRVPDPTWDASNGFGQTLSMLALSLTDDGVPAEAVDFLLAQQCPAGGFRLAYTSTPGCVGDTSADTDATAMAIQALLGVPRTTQVDAALAEGLHWLLERQDPATGAFGGTGPTAAINANSTGVIAQALRAAGRIDAANRAASWITTTVQLNAGNATGTPAVADLGAIAYERGPLDSALMMGIDPGSADQWRRATVQAVLALG
ncbi:MAG: prenyltransferase/squalene oxidase repeat-containing protein, partial [Microthrixaceae bacterium]